VRIATVDRGDSVFAVGFEDQDDALLYVDYLQREESILTEDIVYKDNIFMLLADPFSLKNLYDTIIFTSSKRVYFKDYVTDNDIEENIALSALTPNYGMYGQTFSSLLEYLKEDPNKKYLSYLVIWKT
jgi:hypothetical protein